MTEIFPSYKYSSEDELLTHIFLFIHPIQILRVCSLVSTQWYLKSNNQQLWKFFIENELRIKLIPTKKFLKCSNKNSVYDWRKIYFGLKKSFLRWRKGLKSGLTEITPFDEHFRIIVVGDKKTGKSSVAMRITQNSVTKANINKTISKFGLSYLVTYATDILTKKTIKIQVYDSNIMDIATYIRKCRIHSIMCHLIIIIFNVVSKKTFFNAINKWYPLFTQKVGSTSNMILIGNKADSKNRMVSREEAENAAKERGMIYFEMSALRNDDFCDIDVTKENESEYEENNYDFDEYTQNNNNGDEKALENLSLTLRANLRQNNLNAKKKILKKFLITDVELFQFVVDVLFNRVVNRKNLISFMPFFLKQDGYFKIGFSEKYLEIINPKKIEESEFPLLTEEQEENKIESKIENKETRLFGSEAEGLNVTSETNSNAQFKLERDFEEDIENDITDDDVNRGQTSFDDDYENIFDDFGTKGTLIISSIAFERRNLSIEKQKIWGEGEEDSHSIHLASVVREGKRRTRGFESKIGNVDSKNLNQDDLNKKQCILN